MANKTISQFTEVTAIEQGDLLLIERDNRYYSVDPQNLYGGLIMVKLTITTAQMQALNTTPLTLLAAQGAGTIIFPVNITAFLDHNGTNYATASVLRTHPSGLAQYNFVTETGFVTAAADRYNIFFESSSQRVAENTDYVISADADATSDGGIVYINALLRVVTFG